MEEHRFGGPWTEIKLDVIRKYLAFYVQALKGKQYKLLYIDAFAGTGSRTETVPAVPILGEDERDITYDGSARIALKVDPPFNGYLFIETDKKRCAELEKLKTEFDHLYIRVKNEDANKVISELANEPIWDEGKYRGVIFLDPKGLEIDWSTLEAIANTKSFDVWFLFSVSGVCRQASLNYEKMEDYKKAKLTKLFGTDAWEEAFYCKCKAECEDEQLSFMKPVETVERTASIKQIENWVKERLGTCFPYVTEPLALPLMGSQLYSLFFCVSNPHQKAIELAKKVANYILKQQH